MAISKLWLPGRSPVAVEHKGDESPVTRADREAELAMCSLLNQVVPDHGVYGEEGGMKHGSGEGADFLWVLDPIDGTKSFITGKITTAMLKRGVVPWTFG